jgi:hypothetical protein
MHHDKKGKAETILHAFQTSAADGDEWSATHQLTYFQRKSPWYQLDRKLGGPQSQSAHEDEEKNPCLCWESNSNHAVQSQPQ